MAGVGRGHTRSESENFTSSVVLVEDNISKVGQHKRTESLPGIPWSGPIAKSTSLELPPLKEMGLGMAKREREMAKEREAEENRIVLINDPERSNARFEYSGNKVRTSKYSLLTFLPRNLFEQFHRMAYVYFLVIALLNQVPQLAVFGRMASLFPLLFVLTVTAIKDGYEDWRRHCSDNKENNRTASVMHPVVGGGEYKPRKWKHIRVGEVVKVHANETIPCDLVLLATSSESGAAYVQTTNLDGETNLKTRYASQETAGKHPELNPIVGRVVCQKPGRNIYDFSGFLEFEGRQLILSQNHIILRGCELKNTHWAVGVVVYAGQDTKAMMNSSGAQTKRSRLEQNMNRETVWLSFFLVIICLVGGIGTGVWVHKYEKYLDIIPFYRKLYLELGDDFFYYGVFGEALFAFLSFVIMFQIMIPISLYISMELVRLGQSFFMIRDKEMFDIVSNTRFQCRALNINEDLGQIKYVFSDKTGTLTENKMEFRNASVSGINYKDAKPVLEVETETETETRDKGSHVFEGCQGWKAKTGALVDPKLLEILQDRDAPKWRAVHNYFLALAACNTVVPMKAERTSPTSKPQTKAVDDVVDSGCEKIVYQGESPDEQALVTAAASYGYTLVERTSNQIAINIFGETQEFQVLGVHEFDSTRKCMSVVLECPNKGILVLVKGADSSMLTKIGNSGRDGTDQQSDRLLLSSTERHLHLYSREGLRTLVVAARELGSEDYKAWQRQYDKAIGCIGERAAMLREASEIVERDLTLLGATGIEDKLQDGVPETIAALREAGMKVWVLTGDKQETAISIGYSSALLTEDMHRIVINESEKERCREAIMNAKASITTNAFAKKAVEEDIDSEGLDLSLELDNTCSSVLQKATTKLDKLTSISEEPPSLALIIDGGSLVHALHKDLEQELFELATACKVVICCRVAPFQKAGIVSLVKKKTNDMTVAIGDGANDVSMIQMADVGIGISGQEGRQAVMASDFAMARFKFLKRLLLVHGHWNYNRMSYMVLYNFYRNSVFVMVLFWYIFHTGFSASSAITEWSLVFYSLLYTSAPTIVVGISDKGVSDRALLEQPGLYGMGPREEGYSRKLFWVTMLDTLWQSLVVFYVPFFAYRDSTIDIWSMGSVWTISVVVLVNLHLAMDVQWWSWVTHAALWGSIAATFLVLFLLDAFLTVGDSILHYWVIFNIIQTANYWMNIALIVCLALVPRFFVKVLRERFWPSDIQIARESEILKGRQRKTTVDVMHNMPSAIRKHWVSQFHLVARHPQSNRGSHSESLIPFV